MSSEKPWIRTAFILLGIASVVFLVWGVKIGPKPMTKADLLAAFHEALGGEKAGKNSIIPSTDARELAKEIIKQLPRGNHAPPDDNSLKQYEISILPNITKQMVDMTNDYENHTYRLHDSEGAAERLLSSEPEKGRSRLAAIATEQQQALITYADDMKPAIKTADTIRQTLLRGLQLTDEDRNWDASFKKALGGDFSSFKGKGAANYLNTLAGRATH